MVPQCCSARPGRPPRPRAPRPSTSRRPERQAKVARLVSSMFERSHYRQAPINDPVSSLVLDRYIESARPARAATSSPATSPSSSAIRYQLDDAGRRPASSSRCSRSSIASSVRNRERIALRARAAQDRARFHRSTRSFEFDRAKTRRGPRRPTSSNEIWRKRVKNDALSLMLTDKTWARNARRAAASATSAC